MSTPPFIFGAQYYRAPTPEAHCWEADLDRMAAMGMDCVKYWVQWRWSHRENGTFRFDDLDRLCDLAAARRLDVHFNVIFDVAPDWLYEVHTDAKPVMADGRIVEPYEVAHRQLGGNPGPCLSHPGARRERERFMRATLEHFRDHPAVGWFDVWNEPELCFPSRSPDMRSMTCYCTNCRIGFQGWLKERYTTLDNLNQVWGRCYSRWERIELPRTGQCIQDFIDWRCFQVGVMTGEARWRLDMARELAPRQRRYLHVCSTNLDGWNQTATGADNFALADLHDDVFAASTGAWPPTLNQSRSAAGGRAFYNTESHLNWGMANLHPRIIDRTTLLAHFLPQIGAGIRGFMMWQFHAEVLGIEAPAWGVVRTDGSDRPVTRELERFWSELRPHAPRLAECLDQSAPIAMWESGRNEMCNFSVHQTLHQIKETHQAWHEILHWSSHHYSTVDDRMLVAGKLGGAKLLIMASPYHLDEPQAAALDAWVRAGGVLLCDAHLGAWNGTIGRHSARLPGCGLAERWGFYECESTNSLHLSSDATAAWRANASPDVLKAMNESGRSGGRWYPYRLTDGTMGVGCDRVAWLAGDGLETLAHVATGKALDDERGPLIAIKRVGAGAVLYCGTSIAEGIHHGGTAALLALLGRATALAGVVPVGDPRTAEPLTLRLDVRHDAAGPRFAVIHHRPKATGSVTFTLPAAGTGIFSGKTFEAGTQTIELPGEFCELIRFAD